LASSGQRSERLAEERSQKLSIRTSGPQAKDVNAGTSEYEAGVLFVRLNSLRIVHYMEQRELALIRLKPNRIFLFF
jgi:hypothetical protein